MCHKSVSIWTCAIYFYFYANLFLSFACDLNLAQKTWSNRTHVGPVENCSANSKTKVFIYTEKDTHSYFYLLGESISFPFPTFPFELQNKQIVLAEKTWGNFSFYGVTFFVGRFRIYAHKKDMQRDSNKCILLMMAVFYVANASLLRICLITNVAHLLTHSRLYFMRVNGVHRWTANKHENLLALSLLLAYFELLWPLNYNFAPYFHSPAMYSPSRWIFHNIQFHVKAFLYYHLK